MLLPLTGELNGSIPEQVNEELNGSMSEQITPFE